MTFDPDAPQPTETDTKRIARKRRAAARTVAGWLERAAEWLRLAAERL